MRWLHGVLLILACGPSPRTPVPSPTLVDKRPPPDGNGWSYRDDAGVTITATVLPDPGCIKAGTYALTLDLSTATVTTTSTPRDHCIELATRVPTVQTLTIHYDADTPRAEWNGPQQLLVVDACIFQITSATSEATIAFRGDQGRGTANLALGETCTARDVKLALVRSK